MKLLLIAVFLVVAASAEYSPIMEDYHREYGIAAAARVKAMEEAQDFDGSRIAGGSEAALGAQPHFAGLLVILVSGFLSICGSSLITNTRLVTAAHCWSHGINQAHQFTVVFASTRLYSGGLRINTRRVEQHSRFNERTLENDIAIITVPHVTYTDYIKNINIATGNYQFTGSWAMVSGFGETADGISSIRDPTLRKVSVPIISNQDCARTFQHNIFTSTVCVGTMSGGSPCAGDSGGPLAIGTGDNGILVGVVSFGYRGGCNLGYPTAFARVSSFADWIRQRL